MKESLKAERYIYLSTRFSGSPFMWSVIEEFGPKGCAAVICILMKIADEGGEAVHDKPFIDGVVNFLKDCSSNLVDMVIRRMVKGGLLDRKAFYRRSVLTPPKRFVVSCQEGLNFENINPSCLYMMVCPIVSSEETKVNSEETKVFSEETHIPSEKTLSSTLSQDVSSEETPSNSSLFRKNPQIS